ncbi:MAG: hypothetical protein AAF211_03725 [Myxococcota bacterium]
MWMVIGWLGCSLFESHDLWLDVTAEDGVELHLPANWMLEHDESIDIETSEGRIDLREEAQALRRAPGLGSKRWTPDEDVSITLREQRAASGEVATSVRIGTRGPKGLGLGVTVPLRSDNAQRCVEALGKHIEVEEVDVRLGPAFCAQLAKSAPTTLVRVSGGVFGAVTIETQ